MTRCVCLLLVSACAAAPAPRTQAAREATVVTIPKAAGEGSDAPGATMSTRAGGELVEACEKDDSPGAAERADERFVEARRLLHAKRYADALQVFRASYQATCSINQLFVIGAMLERLDDFDGAIRTLQQYDRANTSEIGRLRVKTYLECIERRRSSAPPIDCLAEQTVMPVP